MTATGACQWPSEVREGAPARSAIIVPTERPVLVGLLGWARRESVCPDPASLWAAASHWEDTLDTGLSKVHSDPELWGLVRSLRLGPRESPVVRLLGSWSGVTTLRLPGKQTLNSLEHLLYLPLPSPLASLPITLLHHDARSPHGR